MIIVVYIYFFTYQEEVVVPKEAPPEFEFLADPPSISAFDLGTYRTH